ncbi:small conductance calcium-activated potassium channel [Carabus blaptoides fortunei]
MSAHDETASLLVGSAITSAPAPANCSKPVLMRQECTTFLVSSHHPQLSVFSDSEEDGSLCLEENSTRSVPDIELHCRLDVKSCKQNLLANLPGRNRSSSTAFQLLPQTSPRTNLERRISQTPVSTLKIVRSVSRESVRSAHHCTCPCLNAQVSCSSFPAASAPPMIVTALPGSRIIRQSSQPEASATPCCGAGCVHSASAASTSLRQLRDHGDGIAGIAADSLRINGAMRAREQEARTEKCLDRKLKGRLSGINKTVLLLSGGVPSPGCKILTPARKK